MNRVILLFLVLVTFCGSSGMCDISEEANPPFNLTVIVLTMNRPKSLERLLNSLKATDFEYDNDSFNVVFHIDKSTGGLYDQTVKLAESFSMPEGHRGNVRVWKRSKNVGLRAAWFETCYYPGKPDNEYCLILEDDLEVSAYWFTWLRKAWRAYSHRTDVAGISLQRQTQMYKKLENNYDPAKVQDVRIQNGDDPFLYRLVGTWGFAPHPARWREMLDWFNSIDHDKFDPYVKGMATSDWLHMHTSMGKRHMTWEQWHIYHSEQHGLYTLYLNIPNNDMALVSNWREAGVHARTSFNSKDFPTLDYCAIQLEYFPEKLVRYDWDAWDETIPPHKRNAFHGGEKMPQNEDERISRKIRQKLERLDT